MSGCKNQTTKYDNKITKDYITKLNKGQLNYP